MCSTIFVINKIVRNMNRKGLLFAVKIYEKGFLAKKELIEEKYCNLSIFLEIS